MLEVNLSESGCIYKPLIVNFDMQVAKEVVSFLGWLNCFNFYIVMMLIFILIWK